MSFAQTHTSNSKFLGSVFTQTFENSGVKSAPVGYQPFMPYEYKNRKGETVKEPGILQVIKDAQAEGYDQFTLKIKTLPSGTQVIDFLASKKKQ